MSLFYNMMLMFYLHYLYVDGFYIFIYLFFLYNMFFFYSLLFANIYSIEVYKCIFNGAVYTCNLLDSHIFHFSKL